MLVSAVVQGICSKVQGSKVQGRGDQPVALQEVIGKSKIENLKRRLVEGIQMIVTEGIEDEGSKVED